MAASTRGVSDDTTPIDLMPNATGDGAGASWHHTVSPNTWAWLFIITALASLWGLGYSFR